ncbi:MAG: hypothetical protein ACR2PG_07885 [Hyphomicrobiaceae bacterium]
MTKVSACQKLEQGIIYDCLLETVGITLIVRQSKIAKEADCSFRANRISAIDQHDRITLGT